jgi:hypothetical protein
MATNYYSQWEKEDTDSWQGKEIIAEEEIDEKMENEPEEEEDDFDGGSMDSYGISWGSFF